MRSRRSACVVAVIACLVLSGCGPAPVVAAADGSVMTSQVTLAGFAVSKSAHESARVAFADTEQGSGVAWASSYGPSGDQSRAVASGLPADVVHVSIPDDIERLVAAGRVSPQWSDGEDAGVLASSVVVFVVRRGNPKNITDWEDLTRADVSVVTPNPGASGATRWNIVAAWASQIAAGGSPEEADAFVGEVMSRVATLPSSSRDATTAFSAGTGDVLLSYENEAIAARQHGVDVDYVIPPSTVRIDTPGAVTIGAPQAASDYLAFVRSDAGQRAFAVEGFRPFGDADWVSSLVVPGAMDPHDPFPTPATLLTVDDVGGWDVVTQRLFAADGVVARLQREAGGAS